MFHLIVHRNSFEDRIIYQFREVVKEKSIKEIIPKTALNNSIYLGEIEHIDERTDLIEFRRKRRDALKNVCTVKKIAKLHEVTLELERYAHGIIIKYIEVPEYSRRKGLAKYILSLLFEFAKMNRLDITLKPAACQKYSQKKLKEIYLKCGFDINEKPKYKKELILIRRYEDYKNIIL